MLRQKLIQPASETASRLFRLRTKLYKEQLKKAPIDCSWCGLPTKDPLFIQGSPLCSENCARSFVKYERKASSLHGVNCSQL